MAKCMSAHDEVAGAYQQFIKKLAEENARLQKEIAELKKPAPNRAARRQAAKKVKKA